MNHRVWAVIIGGLAIVLVAVPVIAYFKKQGQGPAPAAPVPVAPGPIGAATIAKAIAGAKAAASQPANTDPGAPMLCPVGTHVEVDDSGAIVCVSDLPTQIADPNIPLLPPRPVGFSSGVTSGSPGVDTTNMTAAEMAGFTA